MYKNLKIFSFLSFFVLWNNGLLQAVGGERVEEVSTEEIKRKGILKIRDVDGSECGTAVLFQEGKGWMGLGAQHSFDKFPKYSKIAYLGEEKRDVVKVYTPIENIDLVIFVLRSPFENTEGFPTLPESSPNIFVYEGCVYGYGATTSSTHPGSLKDSNGVCRKGEVLLTPLNQIKPETHLLLRKGTSYERTENSEFISFSTFHKMGTTDNLFISPDKNYELNARILDKESLPIGMNNSYNHLLPSSFVLAGDSGGPVISKNNQIYALTAQTYYNHKPFLGVGFVDDILKKKNYKEYFQLTLFGRELSLGFVPEEESIFYIGLSDKNFYSLCPAIMKIFNGDLMNYFTQGKSLFFHALIKIEKETPTVTPYLTQWLEKTHRYNINYFTSIFSQKSWIEKTMPIAFQYIKEQLQTTTSEQ